MLQSCLWVAPLGRSLDVLLRHVPVGPAWTAFRVAGKRAHRMLRGFAGVYEEAWSALCGLALELNPFTTSELLPEWENGLGLPDSCLPSATTLDQRRSQLIFRLTKRRWTTAQDWKDLAALFGIEIIVTPGWKVQEVVPDETIPRESRFRVYIDYAEPQEIGYDYGSPFRGSGYPVPYGQVAPYIRAFECLIDRIRPANVVVVFNANPARNFCYSQTYESTYSDTYCGEWLTESQL